MACGWFDWRSLSYVSAAQQRNMRVSYVLSGWSCNKYQSSFIISNIYSYVLAENFITVWLYSPWSLLVKNPYSL